MEYEFIKKHPVNLNGHTYKVLEVRLVDGNVSRYVGQFTGKTYKEIKYRVIHGVYEEEAEERAYLEDNYDSYR